MSVPTPHSQSAAEVSDVTTVGRWLRPLRADWPRAVCNALDRANSAVVRVAVAEVKGSAPRECGACMLVSREGTEGTIGGGHLEWEATRAAHELLSDSEGPQVRVWSRVLGRELSQCCGGAVQLWLERFTRADLPFLRNASRVIASGVPVVIASELSAARVTRRLLRAGEAGPACGSPARESRVCGPPARVHFSHDAQGNAFLVERVDAGAPALWLYGAGHVGQALIRAISDLPFAVTWIDSRAELLPAGLPDNIRALHAHEPVETASAAPANARYLVMTHDHAVDYALCRAILSRGEFAWLGLIGSRSKGAKFRSRLARDGVAPEMIARMVCPIGVGGVESKSPAAIAIAVAAQLLQTVEAVGGADARADGVGRVAVGAAPNTPTAARPPLPEACSSPDCAQCSSHNTDRQP